jgi:hypothetical protein
VSTQHRWADVVRKAADPSPDLDRAYAVREALALAPDASPSIVGCSVTELRHHEFFTSAAWREVSVALDQAQYRSGEGPCLVAVTSGRPQQIKIMNREDRFPDFVGAALDHGVRSSLSIPLSRPNRTALNIYAADEDAFAAPRAQAVAGLLARCVGQLLDQSAARPGVTSGCSETELEAARSRSAQVRAAVRLLMEREGLSREEAFARLALRSRVTQRTVHQLAVELLSSLESADERA